MHKPACRTKALTSHTARSIPLARAGSLPTSPRPAQTWGSRACRMLYLIVRDGIGFVRQAETYGPLSRFGHARIVICARPGPGLGPGDSSVYPASTETVFWNALVT